MAGRKGRGRRANRRRGARILAWALGLFALAQLTGGLLLDAVWVRPRYPLRADMYSRLRARKRMPEIVLVGSSRFQGDVNCAVLDAELRAALGEGAPRTFNAALPAGDPTVFERVCDDLFAPGRRPRLLVVEVSPETVSRRDNWLHQHALNVLDWRDVAEALPALCRNGKVLYLVRGRLLPLYVHRYHIRKEAVTLAATLLGHGPARQAGDEGPVGPPPPADPAPPPMTPAVRSLLEDGFEMARRELRDYRPGGMAAHRLERLLDRCRSAGVAVVLVGAPVASAYRRAYTPEVDAAFLEYVQSLTRDYGCAYTDWRDRVPDEYFADPRHVHLQGGVYFSRRLAASVLVPLWRSLRGHDTTPAAPAGDAS
jgi:hypothetical protein